MSTSGPRPRQESENRYHWRQIRRALNTAIYHAEKLDRPRLTEHLKNELLDLKRMRRRIKDA